MGNHGNKAKDNSQEVYCLRNREVRIMSEIWKAVETDLVHYGTQFYTLLFRNHPEYLKYFQETNPHEFQVDAPAMRTKFSVTCSTLADLFVGYSHKSTQRENLLGYTAMVHKDMDLTQKDMDNFMMDMMDMLVQNFPTLMTADCCLAYIRYTESLTSRLSVLMKNHRDIHRKNEGMIQMSKKNPMIGCLGSSNCGWLPFYRQELIYGRSAEYWDSKSRYWIVRRAVWATIYGKKKRSSSSGTEIIPKSSIKNISQPSLIADSTSSDAIHDEDSNTRTIKKQLSRRKRRSRKKSNFSVPSNSNVTDDDPEVPTRSSDESATPVRRRGVSIIKSTARERRRRTNASEKVSDENDRRPAVRRLTILNGFRTRKKNGSSSSPNETGERNIRLNSQNSLNIGNKMKNRGTSISNVSNQSNMAGEYEPIATIKRPYADERRRVSIMAKNNPSGSIIAPSGAVGRNTKTNKRVSISKAHWIES